MDKITVLLPGGFKPPHMGHLGLANKFANNPNVSKVIVMVGPTERDGINRQQSLTIWNLLPTNPKVEIIGVSEDNPMNAAFNYVFNLPENSTEVVALGASAKSPEDAKRSQIFVAAIERYKTKPTKDGKFAPKQVKAVNMTDDAPSNYIGRTDDKNGKSIGASILRQDLANGDFINFSTNYPGVKSGIVKSIYNILKKSNSKAVKKKLKERIKNILVNILKEQEGTVQSDTEKNHLIKSKKEELMASNEKGKSIRLKITKAEKDLDNLNTEKSKKPSTVTTSTTSAATTTTTPSDEKSTEPKTDKTAEVSIDDKIKQKENEIETLKKELKSNKDNTISIVNKIRGIKNIPIPTDSEEK